MTDQPEAPDTGAAALDAAAVQRLTMIRALDLLARRSDPVLHALVDVRAGQAGAALRLRAAAQESAAAEQMRAALAPTIEVRDGDGAPPLWRRPPLGWIVFRLTAAPDSGALKRMAADLAAAGLDARFVLEAAPLTTAEAAEALDAFARIMVGDSLEEDLTPEGIAGMEQVAAVAQMLAEGTCALIEVRAWAMVPSGTRGFAAAARTAGFPCEPEEPDADPRTAPVFWLLDSNLAELVGLGDPYGTGGDPSFPTLGLLALGAGVVG